MVGWQWQLVLLAAAAGSVVVQAEQPSELCARRAEQYATALQSDNSQLQLVVGAFLPSIPSALIGGNQHKGKLTHSLWPAVQLALSQISQHPCLLEGVQLQVNASDTADENGQCSASMGMRRFFDMMNQTPRRVALFGDACQQVNMPIAMAAKYWHMLQLSYAETHPKFSGSDSLTIYPTFYRIVPGFDVMHRARLKVLQHYNWTRIGTVKQNDAPQFALTHESFVQLVEAAHNDVEAVVHTEDVNADRTDMSEALSALAKHDTRIIVADVEAPFAAALLCQAYAANMTGPDHVWILPGYLSDLWWINLQPNQLGADCDLETRAKAFEGHFKIEFARSRPDEQTITISGKSTADYLRTYQYEQCSSVLCDHDNAYHGYAYDGIWALALALDRANLEWISEFGQPLNVADAADDNWQLLVNKLTTAMNNISFDGVTGSVSFHDNVRKGIVRVAYFQNAGYTTVGYYDADNDQFSLTDYWRANNEFVAARDQTVRVYQTQYISRQLHLVVAVCSLLGCALAGVFLAINVVFRNHRIIRMSSPNLNNVIIAGCLLVYVCVPVLGVDTSWVQPHTYVLVCYAKSWILCYGFTLSFGAMFSKTWRVHSIFTNIKLNKKAIKDYQLFLIVGVLVCVDTVLLVCWLLVSPMQLSVTQLAQHVSQKLRRQDHVLIPQLEECSSEHALVFQVALYIYKGLLMVLGCFLAWETRRVNVPALNDSKYIGISVYMVVLMSVLGVALSIILRHQVSSSYAIISAFIIVSTTVTLCLLFVPKIIELVRDPKGDEKGYRKGMLTQKHNDNFDSSSSNWSEEELRVGGLEETRIQLQLELTAKNKEIDELLAELDELGLTVTPPADKSDSAFESSGPTAANAQTSDHSCERCSLVVDESATTAAVMCKQQTSFKSRTSVGSSRMRSFGSANGQLQQHQQTTVTQGGAAVLADGMSSTYSFVSACSFDGDYRTAHTSWQGSDQASMVTAIQSAINTSSPVGTGSPQRPAQQQPSPLLCATPATTTYDEADASTSEADTQLQRVPSVARSINTRKNAYPRLQQDGGVAVIPNISPEVFLRNRMVPIIASKWKSRLSQQQQHLSQVGVYKKKGWLRKLRGSLDPNTTSSEGSRDSGPTETRLSRLRNRNRPPPQANQCQFILRTRDFENFSAFVNAVSTGEATGQTAFMV